MSDFPKIDEQVNGNIASETPTLTQQVVEAAEAAAATPAQRHHEEIERALKDEIAALKRAAITAKAEAEDRASDLRLKAAKAIAHKPIPAVRSNVQVDMAFAKLRDKLGGNCYLNNLTPVQQLEAIGIFGTEQIKDSEVKDVMGRSSNSAKANALRRSDPERYSLLRAVSIARKIY